MSFLSIGFLVLFPIMVLVYYSVSMKYKKILLFAFNLCFYATAGISYAVVLLLLISLSYFVLPFIKQAGDLSRSKQEKNNVQKNILCISLSVILCLVILKSGGFGFVPSSSIFFPLGISFYLLEIIGYWIDIYQGTAEPIYSYLDYAVSVSFFSLIQSGPIEKLQNVLKQLNDEVKFSYANVKSGLLRMFWGFFEKIMIADIAALYVNKIYAEYRSFSSLPILIGFFLFAFQLYADFDGYSNIAKGSAQVLGITITQNFEQPYFSTSIKEFWRRWHISLSTWLKDYIYIPLGGNRNGHKLRNLFLTFIVSGIWHGYGLTFIVWGMLHGIYQIVEDLCGNFFRPIKKIFGQKFHFILSCIFNFILVDFAWIFFRANSLGQVKEMFLKVFHSLSVPLLVQIKESVEILSEMHILYLGFGLLMLLILDIMRYKQRKVLQKFNTVPFWVRWFVYVVFSLLLIFVSIANLNFDASNFIYGQF